MITLLACSFGFMFSLAITLCFSFNPLVSSIVLALFAIGVHWVKQYFHMKPPGSFFFIMIASIILVLQFIALRLHIYCQKCTVICRINTNINFTKQPARIFLYLNPVQLRVIQQCFLSVVLLSAGPLLFAKSSRKMYLPVAPYAT